ncbi:MAG TPA: hypothetical protein DD706_04630 [Nitrospiraceae bacterium]|nr:hypothetical protein [Nitrospiraceae bacterium]
MVKTHIGLLAQTSKNVTEYPILFHGLAIGILPAHFLTENGTLHLLGAFDSRHGSSFFQGVMGICFRRLLSDHGDGRSFISACLV